MKYLSRRFLMPMFVWMGSIFAMEPAVIPLSPLDKVFINACKNNKPLEAILKMKPNINAVDPANGYTGLHYACEICNLFMVKLLLTQDANVEMLTHDGRDAVGVARDADCLPVVQYLLDRKLLQICYEDDVNNLPFEEFSAQVLGLLKQGADVNAVSDGIVVDPNLEGFSPLHYISQNGDVRKAQLLLDNGANVNKQSKRGLSPLYIVFGTNVLMGKGINPSQRYEVARFLIEQGADVWAEGANNQSILQVAAISGDVRSIKLLIEAMKKDKKKDWKTIPNVGYDALYEAVAANKEDICLLFLEEGVPVTTTVKIPDGVSLMHIAGSRGDKRIIQELIKRGLSIDIPDDVGQTVLHYIAENGNSQKLKILLDLGANPHVRDNNGHTPLDLSLKNPHKEVRKLLLEASRKKKKPSAQLVGASESAIKKEEVKKEEAKKPLSRRQRNKARQQELVAQKIAPIKIDAPQEGIEDRAQHNIILQPSIPVMEEPGPQSPREIKEKPKDKDESFVQKSRKKMTALVTDMQEKVTQVFTPQEVKPVHLAKTYAKMVGNQATSPEFEEKIATVSDDHLLISVAIPPYMVNNLMFMGPQDNPLAQITAYSQHVQEKMNSPRDFYHNFSTRVEERLGFFAQRSIIKEATRTHSATIKYTIPAQITIFSERPIYGNFEFVIRDGVMQHRFFKPDEKRRKKEKISLTLPASS